MPKVSVDKIIAEDRAREDMGDDYEQLRDSIKNRGLINPICINKEDFSLVAGFRRLSCHKDLGISKIEVKFYENLGPIEKKLLELEENIHKNLTWDEQARLRANIHNLHQELHGKAIKGHESKGWKLEDTARELNVSVATISQDLLLSNSLEAIPTLARIQSRRQALKTLDRAQEIALLSELAKREAEESDAIQVPYITHHGDAVKIIQEKVEDETIDLVIFDPPWGIDVTEIGSSRGPRGSKTSYKDDSEETAINLTTNLLPELYRVMKEDAHMYMFTGWQYIDYYTDLLTGYQKFLDNIRLLKKSYSGRREPLLHLEQDLQKLQTEKTWKFHVELCPLYWIKEGGGFTDFDYKFMPRVETILFCSKGIKKPLNEPTSNAFEVNRPLSTERIHTQEKPIDLIQRFIKISTQPNEIVLDPCAGSFVTTVAATLSGRRSIAIENDEECYMKGVARIAGLMKDDETD